MLQTPLLLMKSLNKTETLIFSLQCVLCFQRQYFRFLLVLFLFSHRLYILDINWAILTNIQKKCFLKY